MNSVLKRILTALVSLFLIAYVGYQAYLSLYHSVKTERVYSSTVSDIVTAKGFVLHNETIITANLGGGVMDYTRNNGERVSNGGIIANIYTNAQDAENQHILQQITSKISQLKDANAAVNISVLDVNMLDNQINDVFGELASQTSFSNLDDFYNLQSKLLSLLNKKQIATGTVKNFDDEIAALSQKSSELSHKTGGSIKTLTSPVSGYFVSSVDGYEGLYDTSKILNITTADITRLENTKPAPASGAVGKVVSEYEWYITCILSEVDARKIKIGASLNARFLLSSENEVPVTVSAINKSSDGYAVVLKCEYMTNKLAVMRMQTVQLIANEFTGIRVANGYIHIQGNQKGVYVQDGNIATFKNIMPVYSSNGYTISALDPTDSARLQVYDEIIVNGDNLYDGKIVK